MTRESRKYHANITQPFTSQPSLKETTGTYNMSDASDYYARQLDNPDRRHEADGIGAQHREAADLALDLIADLCDPEALGHAVPAEVVARAGRIRAMLRPKPAPQCGIGYMEPPPARCQHCDES